MEISYEKYVSIGKICGTFGQDVYEILPGYHSITRWDTFSYPYGVGKVRSFKKMVRENKAYLIPNLGSTAKGYMDSCEIEKCF